MGLGPLDRNRYGWVPQRRRAPQTDKIGGCTVYEHSLLVAYVANELATAWRVMRVFCGEAKSGSVRSYDLGDMSVALLRFKCLQIWMRRRLGEVTNKENSRSNISMCNSWYTTVSTYISQTLTFYKAYTHVCTNMWVERECKRQWI